MNTKTSFISEIALDEYIGECKFSLYGSPSAREFLTQNNLYDENFIIESCAGHASGCATLSTEDQTCIDEYLTIADKNQTCVYRIGLNSRIEYERVCVVKHQIFNGNLAILNTGSPSAIYLVDSPRTAAAYYRCGFTPIILERDEIDHFLQVIMDAGGTENVMLINFDNTKESRNAQKELIEKLKVIGISYLKTNLFPLNTDALDALNGNRESFVENLLNETRKALWDEAPEAKEYYDTYSDAAHFQEYLGFIESGALTAIPTNIPSIDKLTDGGITPGLWILSGQTGSGKTSLLNKIGCNWARDQNRNTVMFCLEMKRHELTGKSISMETYRIGQGIDYKSLTDKNKLRGLTLEEHETLKQANDLYHDYSKRIDRRDSLGMIKVSEIEEHVKLAIKATSQTPLIIVDYLQILKPNEEFFTEKQSIDYNMMQLKKLSQDNNAIVIVISSYNRNSYKTENGVASLNGSSAIEYFADNVILLRMPKEKGINYASDEIEEWEDKDIKEVEIRLAKCRFGKKGRTRMMFLGSYSTFAEIDGFKEPQSPFDNFAKAHGWQESKPEAKVTALNVGRKR